MFTLQMNNYESKRCNDRNGIFSCVDKKVILKEALTEMGNANLGLVCIINDKSELLGLITDGDLRRKLLKFKNPFRLSSLMML